MDKILVLKFLQILSWGGVCIPVSVLVVSLPLILHLMASNLITSPTALPIQLWAGPNICLPRTGCCDTSPVKGKGDFWILHRFTFWDSTQRTFKISHVPGRSLLCSLEQRLPEMSLPAFLLFSWRTRCVLCGEWCSDPLFSEQNTVGSVLSSHFCQAHVYVNPAQPGWNSSHCRSRPQFLQEGETWGCC